MSDKNVVARFAPSPTGFLHIGSVRTALFNYLFAKKAGGKLLLRIEDTDKERSTKEFEKNILDGLAWLDLSFDSIVIQSERVAQHTTYLQKLVDEGKAYISKEEPKEEGQRSEVVRLKNSGTNVVFTDLIRGEIATDTKDLGDFVIAKSLSEPLYHFAVVVDDFEMGITHVIRGEDHISNTARQILIQEAVGAPRPLYAHLPLILATDRSKLSKRKHGEKVSLKWYIDQGFLPEAILNYLALLGWNPGGEQEIFSLKELIEKFDIAKVQKGAAVFDEEKLRWFNKEHIKRLPEKALLEKVKSLFIIRYPDVSDKAIADLLALAIDRISTFGDLEKALAEGEYDYFFKTPDYSAEGLVWKGKKSESGSPVKNHIEKTIEILHTLSDSDFTKEKVKAAIWPYAESVGRGDVLWPFRFALSGREKSADPFVLSEILGKKETLARLLVALKKAE